MVTSSRCSSSPTPQSVSMSRPRRSQGRSAGGSDTQTATASATPDKLKVTGSLTLTGSDNFIGNSDGTCSGSDAYSDISEGTQIFVYNGASEQIAFGPLAQSKSTGDSCVFRFVIGEIPPGENFYNFKIGTRSGASFHQDDLEAGDLQLTLGQ